MLPGGEVRPGELNFVGPLTESTIRSLRFDTAVIGCCGLSAAHGLTAHDLPEVAVKQAAIDSARRVVAATDPASSPAPRSASVCPLDRLDVVVTDDGIPREEHDALTAAGVTVRIADLPGCYAGADAPGPPASGRPSPRAGGAPGATGFGGTAAPCDLRRWGRGRRSRSGSGRCGAPRPSGGGTV